MGLVRVENQAVKIYTPSETRFNERTEGCQYHADYYQLVTCDDVTEIILGTDTVTPDIQEDGNFTTNVSGTTTGTSTNKLIDSGASFTSTVSPLMFARNIASDDSSIVFTVDSDIQLSIFPDYFGSGDDYSISWYLFTGNFAIGTNEAVKTSGAVGTMVSKSLTIDAHT